MVLQVNPQALLALEGTGDFGGLRDEKRFPNVLCIHQRRMIPAVELVQPVVRFNF